MTSLQPQIPELKNNFPLYDTDYVGWLDNNIEKLRSQNYAQVDWENLIEEIADMAKRERRSLKSDLIILLIHLLKWQFQSDKRTGSWERSIIEHRRRIKESLKDSPSLKSFLVEIFPECYANAMLQTKAETGLLLASFPAQSPYDLSQILDGEFLP